MLALDPDLDRAGSAVRVPGALPEGLALVPGAKRSAWARVVGGGWVANDCLLDAEAIQLSGEILHWKGKIEHIENIVIERQEVGRQTRFA